MASTLQDQLANIPGGFDVPFKNYGGSDIAVDTVVILDGTNFVGDGTSAPGTVIPGIVLPATGGNPSQAVGVTQAVIKAGGVGPVRCQGVARCTGDGTITVGTIVDASVTTAGRVKAHTAGKTSFGQALTAGVDGGPVLVFLSPNVPNA